MSLYEWTLGALSSCSFRPPAICLGILLAMLVQPNSSAVTAEPAASTETWDAFYIGDSRVGYAHTTWRYLHDEGRQLIRWSSTNHLSLKRFGQSVTQTLRLASLESTDGQLIRFRSELAQGTVPVVARGQVLTDKLRLETTSAGKTETADLTWDTSWLGFAGSDQLLQRDPLKPGDVRRYSTLLPVLNQVAEVELKAVRLEATELLTGVHQLLRVESTSKVNDVIIQSVTWVDKTGQPLKSFIPTLGQYGYRTTKEQALDKTEEVSFDLGQFSTVRLQRSIPNPHRTKQIVYRVQLKDTDPSAIFVTGASQSVKAIDEQTTLVTVSSIRPADPPKLLFASIRKPTSDDLTANNLIQSDNEKIVKMARSFSSESDPWQVACKLERYVHEQVQVKNFSQAFATAAEVAASLEGDCTEHSVLLAALCRACGIPARVAMGLVYYPPENGFAYHMWNEVWIQDRWVPLDATLGLGGIGAAHLKLADSNLKGATAYSAFLPVLQVLGRIHLEIEEVQ